MEFLVFFIILIIFSLFIDKFLRKWLGVEKKKISETSGKNIDRWGRGIILFIFLCILPFAVEDRNVIKWYWICFLIVSMGFQLFMEWKYLKNSKEYVITVITLTYLLLALGIMYNVDYFI
ncbi:DUF4181 domain-containing protein [Peribacillus sp. NJ11]|uniref:DUF4181 domain-containing protein n=1 Tax=Peribacillus sp. NJ11 TaxID=3055861 RepID=UPI0025A161F8|nr:DUF4181 domain-containing protein [Peribacillus sp. NJ11]MDM5219672.1 DUF4181 domain-containing protein [Peribacillus sp. NJ11]